MEYRIAIPSYKREQTIKEKTLNYVLEACKINPSIVDVFVADKEEKLVYEKSLEGLGVNIILGVPTLMAQRNFITNYYEEGKFILNIDDDVEGVYIKSGKGTILFTDLEELVKEGFTECRKNKTKLFGICAVNNGFYMDYKVSTNLKYIVGCFWGQVIDKHKSLEITLEDKEDYERTIKYFNRFKKVVRLNMYAPKTAYYKEPGGMQVTRTDERVTDSAIYLINKYPMYCSINTTKTKHTEIKLNSRA